MTTAFIVKTMSEIPPKKNKKVVKETPNCKEKKRFRIQNVRQQC
jgi:hypothetical protein